MYGKTSMLASSFTGASTELECCQTFCSLKIDISYEK
jgi:hypothetical protein